MWAIVVLELAQWAIVLVWWPIDALSRGARRLGDALLRGPYWVVVQAKRRRLGKPLWQEHDWKIGIGSPCVSCGANVPPGHRTGCASAIMENREVP